MFYLFYLAAGSLLKVHKWLSKNEMLPFVQSSYILLGG